MASRNKHVGYDPDDLEDYYDEEDDYMDSKYAGDADFDIINTQYDAVLNAVPSASEDEIVEALRATQYDGRAAVRLLSAPVPQHRGLELPTAAAPTPAAVPVQGKKGRGGKKGAGGDVFSLLSGGDGKKELQTIDRPAGMAAPAPPAPAPLRPARSTSAPAPAPPTPAAATGAGLARVHVVKAKTGVAFPQPVGEVPALPADVAAGLAGDKPVVNLVVVGHVDSGKSTTMGRFLVEVGQVEGRTISKYKREADTHGKGSFAYAWVMDQGEEERARGVTVDVAVKHFDTPSRHFTVLDAPGHADFVPNMIAGASQADMAVLMVSANDSEFRAGFTEGKGQTREHALLVRSFGISSLVVAVNKMDVRGWDREAFLSTTKAVSAFLTSCGFKRSKVTFVPISGLNALNLVVPVSSAQEGGATAPTAVVPPAGSAAPSTPGLVPEASWYTGPTLQQALDAVPAPKRKLQAPLRLCVWDVFRDKGLCVTGRIESGVVQQHTSVVVHPNDASGSVKSIIRRGAPTKYAGAGDIVDLVLGGGLDETTVAPGKVLCTPGQAVPVVTRFRAQISTLSALQVPLVKGQQLTLHTQSLEVPVTVSKLMYTMDGKGACTAILPRLVTRDCLAVVKLTLARPTALELYATNKRLGRFTLRYSGVTVAAGMVIRISG